MKYIFLSILFVLVSCNPTADSSNTRSSSASGSAANTQSGGATTNNVTSSNYVQVERLARPGINEGLVIDNELLNAFNSIPPTFDLALDNPTVAKVATQALGTLNAVDTLGGNPDDFANDLTNQVVGGFLPDVMRIDVNAPGIELGKYAYNGDAIAVEGLTPTAVMLTGGRKIEDDVIDITLSYLITANPGTNDPSNSFPVSDNVSYAGVPGNPAQGHQLLYQQSSANGAAQFPFLANPN